MNPILQEALSLSDQGFSIIPVEAKKPLVKWGEYQKKRSTDSELRGWWKQWPDAGIGIVTGKISDLYVIDKDWYKLTPEGLLQAKAELHALVPEHTTTVKVKSPRGGEHMWFKGNGRVILGNEQGIPFGCDLRGDGGYIVCPPSVSEHGSYEFVNSIYEHELAVLPKAFIEYIIKKKREAVVSQKSHTVTNVTDMFKEGTRDADLFHVANCLVKGGMTDAVSLEVLERIAKSCDPPEDLEVAKIKLQSARDRSDSRDRHITAEIREWVMSQKGHFSVTNLLREVTIVTQAHKSAARSAINRMVETGELQHHSSKAGIYRKVENRADDIKFQGADTTPYKITLPLGVTDWCHVYPGNIVLVAGAADAGKTAFLLGTAELNMGQQETYYFSSEMGATELKARLGKTETPLEEWGRGVRFKERYADFPDVIQPDALNIIDYLEVTTDFWQVAEQLKQMHDKLGKGVAVVGLQKKVGSDTGRGGEFTLEKPRIALSIDPAKGGGQRIKIVKGKNWARRGENPRGLVRYFKLVDGCRFMPASLGWEQDKEYGG